MQPNLLLLKDFYRRWWWAYLIGFIVFGAIGAGFAFAKSHTMLPLGGGAFLSAVLLATDLNFRTNARTLLSLPVRADEIARTLWLICVPLSALFILVATALGSLIAPAFGATNPLTVMELLRFLLLTASVNAFMLVVLTYLPYRQPENTTEHVIGGIAGGAWGLGISAGFSAPIFWSQNSQLAETIAYVILVIGIISAIVSWHRCMAMLLNRTGAKGSPAPKNARSFVVATGGLQGLPWLFLRILSLSCAYSFMMQVVTLIIFRLMHAPMNAGSLPMQVLFPAFFISAMMLLPYMTALRHLRSLPLSSPKLAMLFVALPAISLIGILVPIPLNTLIGIKFPLGWLELPLLVFCIGAFCLFLSVLLNIGIKWAIAGIMLIIPSITVLTVLLNYMKVSWDIAKSPYAAFIGLVFLFAAYRWNLFIIRNRSKIYLPHFHQMGRVQFGG